MNDNFPKAPEGYIVAPFSLEAAIPGAEVITRSGRKGRVVAVCDWLAPLNQLLVSMEFSVVPPQVWSYYKTGRQSEHRHNEASDLFMLVPKPEPMTYWVNLYPCTGLTPFSAVYLTEKEANTDDKRCDALRIGGKAHKLVVE